MAFGQTHLASGICLFSQRPAVLRFMTAAGIPIFMACLGAKQRLPGQPVPPTPFILRARLPTACP